MEKITASLAPMAGYTDAPFRKICSEFGAEYTTSEMISSIAISNNDRKTAALARIEEGEAPCVLQIFGHDRVVMAAAAEKLLSGNFPDRYYAEAPVGIDINMGCPVRKIVTGNDGSAMMRDSRNSAAVVESVAEVCARYGVPLSVKIRIGWDAECINAPEFAAAMVSAGAKKITLHCRTREMMYMPSAMPSYCADVRKSIDSALTLENKILLVGNGDIESYADARRYIELGCDEAAVGRGALGFPWIFTQLKDPDSFVPPTTEEILALAVRFTEDVVRLKGENVGIRESRGRAAHFIKGMRGSAKVREMLNHAVTMEDFRGILRDFEKNTAE